MAVIKTLVDGDEMLGFYLLKRADVKQTNSTPPKDYFDFVLSDASGEISGKLWDIKPIEKETYFPMTLVKIQGTVHSYRDKLQVKIHRIRKTVEEDGVHLTDFIRSAPIQPIDLVYTIKQAAAGIKDTGIRAIVEFCISKVEDKLMHYPAAKTHHHAFYAGLAYHLCRMLELGEFIAKQRPFLNLDMIRAGIILHDIAKPEEMIADMGIVTDYSFTGKLLGHISIASTWIAEAALKLGMELTDEKVVMLQHMVLSHHNLGEWGSPVQPQLPEAVALHYIDQLDAKLQSVEDAFDTMSDADQWTQPIRSVENKQIYRAKWDMV